METGRLKKLYESRYSGGMRFLTSRPGVHSVIVDIIKPLLGHASVLDVGCGAGRLSLMCAKRADHVFGLDMTQSAIDLAKLGASATQTQNARFEVRESDDIPEQQFDIALLSEVLEHLDDPGGTLHKLHRHLNENGVLVVSCPSFINFRGYIWMALQEIFGLCMSPSDIRQIYPHDIEKWAEDTGFSVDIQAGLYYDWAWANEAVPDMKRRIRLALEDKKKEIPAWKAVPVDLEALDAYLDSQIEYHKALTSTWVSSGALKQTRDWSVPITAPDDLIATPNLLEEMTVYLQDRQIYYAQQSPVNQMGAGAVYLLRRR